jgi:two-component system cell cycle response regulator DivK
MGPKPLLTAWTADSPVALLVDRDIETRQKYAEYLRLCACVVEEAEDGREALAKAIARQPDVIVAETRLPGLSGIDLCHLLRQDASTRSIPIVFVTGDSFQDQVRRAQDAGADAVLLKPCLPETVLAEILRLLDQPAEQREQTRTLRENRSLVPAGATRFDRPGMLARRPVLSRTHNRLDTTEPPNAPPVLVCPVCDHALRYHRSHIGGVNARHPEQWDYFDCSNGCGTFQYRQRTRRMRKV